MMSGGFSGEFVESMDAAGRDYYGRLDTGVVPFQSGPGENWLRISATDRRGRVAPLAAELRDGKAVPWYSIELRDDGLRALESMDLPAGFKARLVDWVSRTGYVDHGGTRSVPLTSVGTCPVFSHGRAVWYGPYPSELSWLPTLGEFMAHKRRGDPAIPFASRKARDLWLAKCGELAEAQAEALREAEAKAENGQLSFNSERLALKAAQDAAFDFEACRVALESAPYLAAA